VKVFTDDWKQRVIDRYKHLKDHNKPYIYFVAVDEQFQQLRLEIEESVAALPQSAQNGVVTRLRSPSNFTHTYHELVVGRLLRHLGYTVEYEVDIGGLTPDWYVHAKDEIPPFVLEVFTANVSDKRAAELRAVRTLWGWLREIPVTGVSIYVEITQSEIVCDDKRGKQIARSVRQWLEDNPPVGSRLEFDEFFFDVVHYNPKYTSLQIAGPGSAFMVNKEPVRINFKEKIHKYRRVLAGKNLPLVVGVVADFMTGVGFDSFLDLMYGSEAVNYAYNESTGEVRGARLARMGDGLFHREPALSAAAWVERNISGDWQMRGIHNQQAIHPLPISTFSINGTETA
jgi:hypothetical protein